MLAALHARIRWAGDMLYVLDEDSGVIWKLAGLAQVGTRDAVRSHAARLVKTLAPQAADTDPAFLEAARIIGCEGARMLRAK